MAKYNILREDDEFSKKMENKEKVDDTEGQRNSEDETAEFSPGPPDDSKRTPGEEFFTDDIFSAIEADKAGSRPDTMGGEEKDDLLADEAIAPEMDFPSEEEPETFKIQEEETAQADFPPVQERTERPIYDYDDEYKQEGINYKPILIGAGIVAMVVVIFFVVSNVFFGDDADVPEEKIETAAEKLQREQEERKQNVLNQINEAANQRLGAINLLTSLDKENVKYSSVLLYGNSLDLEVFAPNREALAKFNLKIKDNPRIKEYKMESVVNRPGSQGGLFALYDIDLKQIETTQSSISQKANIISPASWETSVQQQAGLNIHSQRKISDRSEDLFTVNRNEYELRGSLNNCLSLINSLASSNQNLSIHKLSLLPKNQQKMSTSAYVLKLVVDYYL
jgi:hypothetical protein